MGRLLPLVLALVFLPECGQLCFAAAPSKRDVAPQQNVWTFGHSRDRNNPLWRDANDADIIVNKTKPGSASGKKGAVDTSGGIKRALDQAGGKAMPKAAPNGVRAGKPKDAPKGRGSVGMSMVNESSAWKVAPGEMKIDEYMPRDRKHVVRAFADVKAGDDLDIRVGPELHLRDDSIGAENAHEKQPDSSLGVGMHFKFDF